MDFYSSYAQGFARIAACTGPVRLADPHANAESILTQAKACHEDSVAVAIFPEMGLTGYAIDDLLLQETLLAETTAALTDLVTASADLLPVLVVGAPLRKGSRLFNCAIVIHRGQILGVAPKSYLPNYREFYEKRHFAPGDDQRGATIECGGREVPFGPDLLFRATDLPGLTLHVEVCEDLWVPIPPSTEAALAGATVLANLSASPITVGRADDRHLLARAQSARCLAAYAYTAAGEGESTTDLSWDGMTMVYEGGELLGETTRFPTEVAATVVDVDLDRLAFERRAQGSFDDNRRTHEERAGDFREVSFELGAPAGDIGLRRKVDRFPFVPDDAERLAQDCYEAYNIQVHGLVQRLRAIGKPKAVIGVSGGLDSTHALLVAAQAMDRLGRPRSDILAFTMPGFATSDSTKSYATRLAEAIGVTFAELDIRPAAEQMLRDLDHPAGQGEPVYDVTFENVQAGLRYDYLFRLANARGGIVVGTGDMSELALGWCTYGVGDQMSHYNVNAGIPKTMIQHVIRWVITEEIFDEETDELLQSILDQEISPELVPAGAGEKPQSTEDAIGPYALQDFNLFHLHRRGARPSRIAFLAHHAWHDKSTGGWPTGYPESKRIDYDLNEIRHWLEIFLKRFFGNQFKRSALPNGPKVVSGGSMSPRGDWRMPSDASADVWIAELERCVPRP
ncbi:NAD(+) synthase [Demetria terragena]|uniref:NAD(+) synthase n=1 Tax=Demetria terragena TaxID=63959 RepID=UPI00037B6890|nr:NAD(+) synthase [Demetria terragena]